MEQVCVPWLMDFWPKLCPNPLSHQQLHLTSYQHVHQNLEGTLHCVTLCAGHMIGLYLSCRFVIQFNKTTRKLI